MANVTSRVSKRIGAIATSATLAVSNKAKELKAQGKPVIGFGAGEPDFPTPDYIVEAAVAAAKDPENHKYSPGRGLPELREAIAKKTLRDSGYEVDPANVLVTNGAKQAVTQTFATLLDPGDEVLMPTPYWTTYPEVISLSGGVTVPVFADAEQNFKITVAQLEEKRTDKTKAVLICSPTNPTGAVYTPAELRKIGQWALEKGVWVIADEIYEHLLYDGAEPAHIVKEVPELADQTVVINGVAKTYAMTGWRVGWMIGPKDVITAAANLQSHLTSNVCNVAQRAALEAVSGPLTAVEEMREAFDRRRRTVVKMLNQIDGFTVPTPQGAFYVYASVKDVLGREIAGQVAHTSAELAQIILHEAEVAAVPGEAFGPSGYLRFSYALGDEDLVEGISRVQKLIGTK
ncbi:pyridoxal phosphate-dependent aminotransferase [Winkia sp. UMB6473-AN360BR]|uniref:pyridoxal phosphate-dependent aminotransferase n=1 Tax=Winkia sp. UMB6473-AN360BR TaxID=3050611 RepID=UPI0025573A15|nr:pyridoxal phosphate-dependent aminotransferase [Winkia sp. UMB6473-AN360BR]MDK8816356.1 pyridoxal phosphate-dependent aminotransferase [Winkia sp. UMB6473-AN360BR]